MGPFSEPWLSRYQSLVNADPEMRVVGDWFTVTFSLTCGETRAIVKFERGRLAGFVVSPRIDERCAFGFRSTPEIWQRFLDTTVQPLYHAIFAMIMRVPGFVLEGDTLVAMQHARALHRAMTLMKGVAAA
jgi:hypothetical protein